MSYSEKDIIAIVLEHIDYESILKKHPEITRSKVERIIKKGITEPVKAGGSSFQIWVDGASRGNPGDAGIGAVIKCSGNNIHIELGKYIGRATNNAAEYQALIAGIEEIRDFKLSSLLIYSDSELLVRQIQGIYKVRNPALKEYNKIVMRLLSSIPKWKINHIPREKNRSADLLANRAIDEEAHEKKYWVYHKGEQHS